LRRLIIVSKEPVNIDSYLSGQEYYLYMLTRVLRRIGVDVGVLTIDNVFRGGCRADSLHLYYLGFRDVVRLRGRCGGARLVYHVYHIDDATWSRLHSISWRAFIISIQPHVDAYLATARSVYEWVRLRAPMSRHVLAEPYYECSCKSFERLPDIVEEKFSNIRELRLLYIGRINPYRLPLNEVLNLVKRLSRKVRTRLTIVSKIGGIQGVKKLEVGDGTIEVISMRIPDNVKCMLYRDSHFFLYLARGNVAMNPPITLLESVYHGVLPVSSPVVLKDLDMPGDLVVNNFEEAFDRILKLLSNVDLVVELSKKLGKWFGRFYDLHRFFEAVKQTI